jgi:crotonobetainyl-CoA:carnitine CoA-transferase CaiB-like acyl-CoA transferase
MLNGLKIVEHATYIAAPGCGAMLADWGADVIKIEPPGGDPIRRFFDTIGAEAAFNPVFEMDNRGKRSVVADTTQEGGRDVVRRLAAGADVFLTNVRPGGLARAGLDPASLMADNPRLIYACVTGYGLDGPDAERAGFDIAAYWSRSGVAQLTAPKDVEPFPLRTGMGDHVTSMATAAGVMAALFERTRTGRGRIVDASLLRAGLFSISSDLAIQLAFGRLASTRPRAQAVQPLANFFRTADERWICIVPRQTGDEWGAIRRALALEALDADERFASAKARRQNGAALVAALDAAFAGFAFADIAARLDAEGIVWAPVQRAADVVIDPQVRAGGGIVAVPDETGPPRETIAAPVTFPGAETGPRGRAPGPGEHTRAVLAELGYDGAAIDALLASGAVRETA